MGGGITGGYMCSIGGACCMPVTRGEEGGGVGYGSTWKLLLSWLCCARGEEVGEVGYGSAKLFLG